MATREEMLAELEVLRAKLAEMDGVEERAAENSAVSFDLNNSKPTDPVKEEIGANAPEFPLSQSELERLLEPLGVSGKDVEALTDQLWKELDTLPQNKPLITAIGAFGLGFLLGRMTK